MIHKVKGVVLHHVRYKESSAIVYMYTDLLGRQAYLVNSIRGKKSRFSGTLLQSLTFLEMEAYHKEGRELQRLKDMHNYIPFRSIPYDIQKSTQILFLAEVLYKTLQEEEPNPGLFAFLENGIQWLDVSDRNLENFHLIFLLQLTRFLGFYPENNYREGQTSFDMRNGQFSEGTGMHPDFFSLESSKILSALLGRSFGDPLHLSLNQEKRVKFLEDLMEYFRLHVYGFGKLKSLPVLHELYREYKP